MEILKPLADVKLLQNQLIIAIQNHQRVLQKQLQDPTNEIIQKELYDAKQEIRSLGQDQKKILNCLREELDGISIDYNHSEKLVIINSSTFGTKSFKQTFEEPLCVTLNEKCKQKSHVTNLSCDKKECDTITTRQKRKSSNKQVVLTQVPDAKEEQAFPEDVEKIQFMLNLGLVTQRRCYELQNRRVERKRRSTANHSQFVYENGWEDITKRKKSFLSSVETRQPNSKAKASSCDSVSLPVVHSFNTSIVKVENRISASSPVLDLEENSKLLDDKPASNFPTCEVCVICREPGSLQMCCECTNSYHEKCVPDDSECHHRFLKQEGASNTITKVNTKGRKPKFPDIAALHERRKLLIKENDLLKVKLDKLDKKVSELNAALGKQTEELGELHQREETVLKKIKCIHDFINRMKGPLSSGSS